MSGRMGVARAVMMVRVGHEPMANPVNERLKSLNFSSIALFCRLALSGRDAGRA